MAEYRITLQSPLGERQGTLSLYRQGESFTGTISLLGSSNPFTGTRQGGTLCLTHPLRTQVSTLECETTLQIKGDTLTGTIHVGCVHIPLCGELIPKEETAHGTAE